MLSQHTEPMYEWEIWPPKMGLGKIRSKREKFFVMSVLPHSRPKDQDPNTLLAPVSDPRWPSLPFSGMKSCRRVDAVCYPAARSNASLLTSPCYTSYTKGCGRCGCPPPPSRQQPGPKAICSLSLPPPAFFLLSFF